ncbi:hypothetical protein K3495_g9430 [Podosphaera aphanis]|nr:hypothetical protein K3495_g9430 [Podosphaera aphanis]
MPFDPEKTTIAEYHGQLTMIQNAPKESDHAISESNILQMILINVGTVPKNMANRHQTRLHYTITKLSLPATLQVFSLIFRSPSAPNLQMLSRIKLVVATNEEEEKEKNIVEEYKEKASEVQETRATLDFVLEISPPQQHPIRMESQTPTSVLLVAERLTRKKDCYARDKAQTFYFRHKASEKCKFSSRYT